MLRPGPRGVLLLRPGPRGVLLLRPRDGAGPLGAARAGRVLLTLPRRALAEAVGTALLVAAVVGSGVAAERLSPRDAGLALLENALATAGALAALLLALGPVSGAHLNPVVSAAEAVAGRLPPRDALAYAASQAAGGAAGAVLANAMFGLPAVSLSTRARDGLPLLLAEVVATAGLLLAVRGTARSRPGAVPAAVAAWIGGAYFFTSSTSFANPAVTLARALSDTFAGIAPSSVAPFVLAQAAGAALALVLGAAIFPETRPEPRA
jgi:arsenate reductase